MARPRIVVVGGGAAGFFGALRAAALAPQAEVTILERGKRVLEKVRVSGGGRCNVTHACFTPDELVRHYPRGKRELLGPFHRFACGDMLAWLDERGVATKIEEDGRIFPTSDDSATIIDCLVNEAQRLGIRVLTGRRVTQLLAPDATHAHWRVATDHEHFPAERVYLTAGSSPRIWQLLTDLGHHIVPAVPSLFTFNTKDTRLRQLAGLALPWAQVAVKDQRLAAEGPLLITHWGLSGPAVLRLSAWGARELAALDHRFTLSVNWLAQSPEQIKTVLDAARRERSRQQIMAHTLFDTLPLRLWKQLVAASGVSATQQWAQLSRSQADALAAQLTAAEFSITGKSTFKEEFVTAGGVDLREVDFRTFSSKLHPGLYFAGEVLDIDAITGGFNFQAAWTGGYVAGEAMVQAYDQSAA